MTMLVAATVAFLATHFVTSTPLRPALVSAMGEWPYRGAYSLVALITLVRIPVEWAQTAALCGDAARVRADRVRLLA